MRRRELQRVLTSLPILASLLLTQGAAARTLVEQVGPCDITITVRIEIWGDPSQAIDSRTAGGDDLEVRGAANQETADAWKAQIESVWNTATMEQAEELARQEKNTDYKEGERLYRFTIEPLVKRFREATGTPPGLVMDCCTVRLVADVRPRSGGADDGTEGWHQIQAVRSHYMKKGVIGSIPGVGDYLSDHEVKWFRSWQYLPKSPDQSVTGAWAHRPGRQAAAHEVGHILNLDDEYTDVEGEDGKTRSKVHKGHENDLMGENQAYPTEEELKKVLEFFEAQCAKNCCPTDETAFMLYTRTAGAAGTAIAACNRSVMEQTLQSFRDQMGNLGEARMPFARKYDLYKKLKEQIRKLELELIYCPRVASAVLVGTDGTPYEAESDDPKHCRHGDGIPVAPPTITLDPPDDGEDPRDTAPPDAGAPTDDDGEDPRDAAPPAVVPGATPKDDDEPSDVGEPEEPTGPAEPVTVHCKTASSATGKPVGKRRVKLIDPSLTNPKLALDDASKVDSGFDEDPKQCLTDAETGGCEIESVPLGAQSPAAGAGKVEMEIPVGDNRGVVVAGDGLSEDSADLLAADASALLGIGGKSYFRMEFDRHEGLDFGLKYRLDDSQWEEDECRKEEPGPWIDHLAEFPDKPSRGLPGAAIRLEALEGLEERP